MRKFLLSSMMVLLAMASSAQGSYTADFNTAIDTSDPAFRVAPGWSHLVSTGSYTSQKVTYTYVATGGIDGSGCLQAGAQSYFDWWENADVALNDLLITPAVSGTVTLQAMKATSGDNCSVRFFNMSKDDNGNWVMGTEIAYDDLTRKQKKNESGIIIGVTINDDKKFGEKDKFSPNSIIEIYYTGK